STTKIAHGLGNLVVLSADRVAYAARDDGESSYRVLGASPAKLDAPEEIGKLAESPRVLVHRCGDANAPIWAVSSGKKKAPAMSRSGKAPVETKDLRKTSGWPVLIGIDGGGGLLFRHAHFKDRVIHVAADGSVETRPTPLGKPLSSDNHQSVAFNF